MLAHDVMMPSNTKTQDFHILAVLMSHVTAHVHVSNIDFLINIIIMALAVHAHVDVFTTFKL